MNLIILDISSSNLDDLNEISFNQNNDIILSLTPSSFYYLDLIGIEYISFHNLISIEKFQKDILKMYDNILNLNIHNYYFKGFFREVAQYINYYYYLDIIINYIKINNFTNIHYITDKRKSNNELDNSYSLLYKYIDFTKITIIDKQSSANKLKINFLLNYSFIAFFKKLKNRLFNNNLKYDWFYINPRIYKKQISINQAKITFDINNDFFKYIDNNELQFNIVRDILQVTPYITFITKDVYSQIIEYLNLDGKLYFFQHGSYLYKNIFIKYSEVELADINFVFNDYTKKLFKDLNAKKVYNVGSILFNRPIKEKKKKYDFLYITQGHDYFGNLQYVDFTNSLHSFDGYELYQRHKSIIELFGTKFSDKKIMIRVHPCVVTTGIYVPFWELSKKYKNITIDVSIPIHNLIEKSKYIISDYFTTEFINRELHYKRDIILFEGAPTPLPKDIMKDMDKMFILVDTVNDLKEKIENIENITKNRKRYDDIIEYYSSKKCDTKKVVTEILEKELNGR